MATVIGTTTDLHDLLAGLGRNPDAVADALRERHVTGHRKAAERCPIANWLTDETGAAEVMVDIDTVTLWFDTAEDGPNEVSADLPNAAADFVVLFDNRGAYPFLDAGGEAKRP